MASISEIKLKISEYTKEASDEEVINFETDDIVYQYIHGTHNVTLIEDRAFDRILNIVDEKQGYEIQQSEPKTGYITFIGPEDPKKDIDIFQKIFSARNISIQDLTINVDDIG